MRCNRVVSYLDDLRLLLFSNSCGSSPSETNNTFLCLTEAVVLCNVFIAFVLGGLTNQRTSLIKYESKPKLNNFK